MKISPETIEILHNFAAINQSLYVYKSKELRTVRQGNMIMATATVVEDWPRQFGIYDLPQFLSALNLFDSPNLDFADDGTHVVITDDNRTKKVRYFFASPSLITHPYPKNPGDKETHIILPETEVNFQFSKEKLNNFLKAAGVLQLTDLIFHPAGDELAAEAINSDNPTSNAFEMEFPCELPDADFNFILKIENMTFLPRNYDVGITKANIGHFMADDIEYWVTLHMDSTYSE